MFDLFSIIRRTDGYSGLSQLLDDVIAHSGEEQPSAAEPTASGERLARFLNEPEPARALLYWAGTSVLGGEDELKRKIGRDIARIDEWLSDQVNAILHHARFQKLEASWRSLHNFVEQVEEGSDVKIKVLNVSWKEIAQDQERALEFDQSKLFRKVYEDEFGMAGGEPFGVLIGDYEIRPRVSKQHPIDDVATLRGLAGIAAAAFAPLIMAAHPTLLGPDDFSALERPIDLNRVFDQLDYLQWNKFREDEDSRFVGLTLPRVLARLPYEDDGSRVDGFRFHEDVAGPDKSKYLWGNAAYAFGSVLVRSFADFGWLANIRGTQRGVEGGGLVTNLPVHSFSTDKQNLIQKSSTDVTITDDLERSLSELGFIPLCHCKDTEYSVFYSNQSVQKPAKYDRQAATVNAHISAMLQYILCVSRFSHYLKLIGRDKLGTLSEAGKLESELTRWLMRYVSADTEAAASVKARLPLREAQVSIREDPSAPGSYYSEFHLWPHYELDELSAAIKVTTKLGNDRNE